MKKNMLEVTCVIRDSDDLDSRIDKIGGVFPNGKKWTLSIDEAISEMKNTIFYVTDKNHKPVSIKSKTRNGIKYLTTAPDDSQKNNLLS